MKENIVFIATITGLVLIGGALWAFSPDQQEGVDDAALLSDQESVAEEQEERYQEEKEPDTQKEEEIKQELPEEDREFQEDTNDQEEPEKQTDQEDLQEQEESDPEQNDPMETLVSCLEEEGVVIYGSVTCPFCTELANEFGGYEVIDSIYVECTEEPDRCDEEMIGRGVPEIQIEGEMYQGSREPAAIGQAVGCEL